MNAFFVIRAGGKRWHVIPLLAVKCGMISLAIILFAFFTLDRIVLPGLERRGLTSGDDWTRHNSIVVKEHQLADRTDAFPETPTPLIPAGVRSWVGQPVDFENPLHTKRILVMGDSFVWGSPYTTLNHMWWRQLGQLLESDSVEVVALGRPGATTRDQLQWAKYFVRRFKPDLIIWGYVTNDADEGLIRQISVSQESIPKLDRVRNLARSVWPRMMAKFDALRSNKLAVMYTGPKYGYEYSEWELKLVEPTNLVAYSKTIEEVKSFLDEVQIPSFMMTLPNFPSTAQFNPRYAPILKVWREAGIPTYDTIPEFVRRYGETPLSGADTIKWGINPGDAHPGPRSCHFLAEQANEIVRRDFPQVLGRPVALSANPVINDWLPNFPPDAHPQSESGGRIWKMTCPADETRWPTMPLGIPSVLLAFKNPQPLSSLALTGTSLKSAQLWVSFLDDTEHFDDGVVHDLGEKNGSNLKWDLSPQLASRAISLIRFRATFLTSQRELEWTFTPKAMVGE